jgi:UDP-N-acetylmuramate--alanine ligase
VDGAGCIIRTAAVREDNVEIKAARERGIPVFERAQAWGYIMSKYKNAVCVAGVHGKTSTTSMLTHVLLAAQLDPTIMIGGMLPVLNAGYRVGKGDVIALESCEYYNSFHNFCPTVAVVLNVDADHLDFFQNLDDLINSFRKFASLVPDDGYIVCNGDDKNTMEALVPLGRDLLTFGFCETGLYALKYDSSSVIEVPIRVRGVNINSAGRNPSMDVLLDGKPLCKITLQIPGAHNLRNALAAVTASLALGIPVKDIEDGLYSYEGVGRRFEFKGKINGADVYDDYAHHPSELRATLNAVSTLGYERIILAFQPHTFSRTKALFDDFVTELSRPEFTFLAPIYSAREKDDRSISSDVLAAAVPNARCLGSLKEIADEIEAIARPGDIILTAGAGDIYKVGDMLIN